jgi:hypothetical protein
MNKKLKSLALILRSLPPATQKAIFEQLPLPLVQKISDVDLSIDETLSSEDWDYFAQSWPEFFNLIDSVKKESVIQRNKEYILTERPKIKDYIEYKLGLKRVRPNLSHSIARIIDEVAFESV